MPKFAKRNSAAEKVLNAFLRNVTITSPADVYLALFTADPGDTGPTQEISGNGYARVKVTFDAPVAASSASPGATGMEAHSNIDVIFPKATGPWTTGSQEITHGAICDRLTPDASGTDIVYYGEWTEPKTIGTGDRFEVDAGDVIILED